LSDPAIEERNKAAVLAYFDRAWVRRDLNAFEDHMEPGAVLHLAGYAEPFVGIAAIKEWAATYLAAFPDITFEIEAVLTGGDYVTLLWHSKQTHLGSYLGVAPVGTRVSMTATMTYHLNANRIVEAWTLFDPLDVMQQLGVLPKGLMPKPLLAVVNTIRRLRRRKRAP
jgi:predicted ester cyclase